VEEFLCAVQKSILLQGKMYISQKYVCFFSNILGYMTKVTSFPFFPRFPPECLTLSVVGTSW